MHIDNITNRTARLPVRQVVVISCSTLFSEDDNNNIKIDIKILNRNEQETDTESQSMMAGMGSSTLLRHACSGSSFVLTKKKRGT